MPCYHFAGAIVCGNLGPKCRDCGGVGGLLCDYPVGDTTCNRPMCAKHATEVGPDRHYCRLHVKVAHVPRDLFAA